MGRAKPLKLSADPIGTIDELRILNLPGKVVPTCSEPVNGRNVGCQYFAICEREDKGRPRWARAPGTNGPDDQGVRNHNFGNLGIYVDDPSTEGAPTEDVVPCYHLMPHIERMRGDGVTVEVVAEEGEYVKARGTIVETRGQNSKGQARERVKGVEFNRLVKPHRTMAENEKVKRFLRGQRVTEALKENKRSRRLGEVVQRDRSQPRKLREAIDEKALQKAGLLRPGAIDSIAGYMNEDDELVDESFELQFQEDNEGVDSESEPGSPRLEPKDAPDQRVRPRNGTGEAGMPKPPKPAAPKQRKARRKLLDAPTPVQEVTP